MKWILIALGLLTVLAVVGIIVVRTASHDPARWHVDPLTVSEIDPLNQYLASSAITGDVETISAMLPDLLGGDVLDGSYESGFVTVVVRTALIGFPDYVSVRIAERDADSSDVTLFSRSRYGKSDLGANKARVEEILSALRAAVTARTPNS